MKKSADPYGPSNRAISLLNKKAVTRFQKAKKRGQISGFDELNIISIFKELYAALEKDNKQAFEDLALLVYWETEPHGEKPPNGKWLKKLLSEYDPVTLYVYLHEVERKRDRATEAVNSAKKKAEQFKKHLAYWSNQTTQYADTVTDQARMKAFKDAGVKRVMWNTQKDEKVCKECGPMDGKIFDIDAAPPKKHWRCRCYYTAVL